MEDLQVKENAKIELTGFVKKAYRCGLTYCQMLDLFLEFCREIIVMAIAEGELKK